MRRRRFLQASLMTMSGLALAACDDPAPASAPVEGTSMTPAEATRSWLMPEEGQPHKRTWMAFGASEKIWGARLLLRVRQNLATIATTIARYEPVSMLVRPSEVDLARGLVGPGVELVAVEVDDLWIRDTGLVFVKSGGDRAGVDFNFNGWGGKQEHGHDAGVARFVAGRAAVETVRTDLVMEGGGLEVDGEGTAIITESCVLNSNRNRHRTKADVESALARLLGIKKVIWLPGIAGKDITDGHTDFYARFAGPGVVVAGLDNDTDGFDYEVTRRHLEILRAATDAKGRKLRVETLEAPTTLRAKDTGKDFAAGYINFYVCNGAVIAPEFGDPTADPATQATLARLFPGREVVQIDIDAIAAGGGGIHCTTQQEPAA
ncbi:agmatine deiminase [Actinosynnema sp. ALI-1.44]|uniref:agmatine deiminase family protein n=1 Tax=Actinosynnema sp. ALI-1.44 TaxID=1933779 RepID=UPI00097BD345|nr:agmatine deiminase family protein [Actinosynnema sp. ALI-1.44]ONI70386.1 agmatine deiminase [Actinosynnema sp. ALI-1.44]